MSLSQPPAHTHPGVAPVKVGIPCLPPDSSTGPLSFSFPSGADVSRPGAEWVLNKCGSIDPGCGYESGHTLLLEGLQGFVDGARS